MKTFSVEWSSCHGIVLCRLLLSARMPTDAQNIEKQTPQFLFPSSVNQLNALNFFQVEEIVVRREIVLPVIILEYFVSLPLV